MRATNRLTALQIKNAPAGKYADGGGLWLHRRADGGGQWFLRVTIHGRRREMGLGSLDHVGLKEARQEAEKWRTVVRQGKDPIKERERLKREADRSDTRLSNIAHAAFEAKKAELKGDGKAGRWMTPLELHVLPKLGKVPIEEIDQRDIKTALEPIWHTKAETARKAMNRLGIVIRYGAAMGLDVDLQATLKAKELLGKSRHRTQNIPAIHWKSAQDFYSSINGGSLTELALRFLMLTVVRSGPLRKARWEQFSENLWTIPGENMKSLKGQAKDFTIPLSSEALRVLDQLAHFERDGFVFPGQKSGVMSDMSMTKFLSDRGHDFRPHGFRTTFRTWCSEETDFPDKHVEKCLAHTVGSKVQQAYERTEFLEQRQNIMERWGNFLAQRNGRQRKLNIHG